MSHPPFRPVTKRPYARRLPSQYCRRAMLSIRVSDNTRHWIKTLAARRGISPSEYVARLIHDHLTYTLRVTSPSFAI